MTPPASSQATPRVLLDERSLWQVLLVRAVEETDREGALLTRAERERATALAARELPEGRDARPEELALFLDARARALAEPLAERVELLRRLRGAQPRFPLGLFALVLFGLGLATHLIGGSRRIHVVANPLLALILWNLAVYGLLAVWSARAPVREGSLARHLGTRVLVGRGLRALGAEAGLVRTALTRAATDLARAGAPLYAARGQVLLHLGAIALVLGALGGLYLRGLVLEYQATWESTFLSQHTTERALEVLFAPATLLSGIALPRLEPGGGPAADWIHLYAVSVLLVVLLPRTLLAWRAERRARALASALALDAGEAYFLRLFAAHRGEDLSVHLVPYSHLPAAQARDELTALLHDVFGARARVQAHAPLPYGAEAGELLAALGAHTPGTSGPHVVPVFALAQTPESEVHGRLVTELAAARPGEPVLVIVDGSGYRERLGGGDAARARAEEHRRNWDRVLRAAGVAALHADLGAATPAELVQQATACLNAREEPWSTSR